MAKQFLLVFFALAMASGQPLASEAPPDYAALQTELDANRALWVEEAGDASYDMTISRSCFCIVDSLGPFTLSVENDQIVAVDPDNGFSGGLPTILGLFDLIQNAIDNKYAAIEATYDATLGYPSSVFLDQARHALDHVAAKVVMVLQDFRIADEEIGYTVTDVVIAPPPFVCDVAVPPLSELTLGLGGKLPAAGFSLARYYLAYSKWARYQEQQNCAYKYKLTRSCFCDANFIGPFTITVENSQITSAVNDGTGSPVPAAELANLPTVIGLFDIILDEEASADAMQVTYDSETGLPTRAAIDRIVLAIDDEVTYEAELVAEPVPSPAVSAFVSADASADGDMTAVLVSADVESTTSG